MRARVESGRIVVDEATDLPEGTEVELVALMDHGEDALEARDRAALHRSLARTHARPRTFARIGSSTAMRS